MIISSHKTNRTVILCCCFVMLCGCHHPSQRCHNLTGTWSGRYQDPNQLFAIHNQQIRLQIVAKNGVFFGTSQADDAISGHAISGTFSGQCINGKLSKVYLQNPQHCGHYAPDGTIRNKKLTLYLPYENAMTQTDFQIEAQRIQSNQPNIKARPIQKITTCH